MAKWLKELKVTCKHGKGRFLQGFFFSPVRSYVHTMCHFKFCPLCFIAQEHPCIILKLYQVSLGTAG